MPTARKLPSGSWRVRVFSHWQYDEEGKKKAIYESFTSSITGKAGKAEAERMASEWKYKKKHRGENQTVHDVLRQYVDMKTQVLSPSTIRGYECLLRNNYEDIESVHVRDLDNQTVQQWISAISAGLSPKTVRNVYALFTAAIEMAVPDTTFHVSLPAKKQQDLYTPNDADIKKLLDVIKGKPLEIAVYLAAFCSLRRGEICAVTSSDVKDGKLTVNKCMVKDKNGLWVIKQPKTYSSYRVVDLPEVVQKRIDGIDGRLYPKNPNKLTNAFRRAIKRAECPEFRFHDLRHYYVSISHALGIPDAYIMESGGWKTTNVMNRVYRDTLSDVRKKEADVLSKHFDKVV